MFYNIKIQYVVLNPISDWSTLLNICFLSESTIVYIERNRTSASCSDCFIQILENRNMGLVLTSISLYDLYLNMEMT